MKTLKSLLRPPVSQTLTLNESTWQSYRRRAVAEAVDTEPLDATTPTVAQIAKKHGKTVDYIESQLKIGTAVEAEHTTHPDKAREIALDHLGEVPDYYVKLKAHVDPGTKEMAESYGEQGLVSPAWPKGTQVHIPHNGKMVKGKIVRYDKGEKHGTPFYVVDHGAPESKKVPLHQIRLAESKMSDQVKIGDRVHAGVGTKGGAGYRGIVRNVDGNGHVHVEVDTDAYEKYGPRTIIVPRHHVTREGTRLDEAKLPDHEREAKLRGLQHYGGGEYGNEMYITHRAPKPGERWQGLVRLTQKKKVPRGETTTRPLKESEIAFNEGETKTYNIGDKVIPRIGPHKGQVHTVIHVHSTGHLNIRPDVHVSRNKYRLGAAKAAPSDVRSAPLKESYSVGDRVVPKIGPHKGQVHRVIHVHPTGHVNITPARPGKNRYALGAAKAHPDDLTQDPLKEARENTYFAKRRHEKEDELRATPKARRKIRTNTYYLDRAKRKKAGLDEHVILRQTVREAFESSKDKKNLSTNKVKDADFKDDKALRSPGDQDPQQASAEAPTPKKASNAPTPSKNSKKLQVKGPGAEDRFQPEPIVTPITALSNPTPGYKS